MKKIFFCLIIIFCFLLFSATDLLSFWIWTPESGKWINPKYSVKDTPSEQYKYAMTYFNNSDYKKALKEFEKLVDAYPKSKYAPKSQYFVGRSYEKLDKYYKAFEAYQVVIDKYPYTEKVDEILKREIKIGNIFFKGRKGELLGMPVFPAEDRAIEIFKKVVKNSPYGEGIDEVYYKLGITYRKKGDYRRAKESFNNLIKNFPNSPLADKAEYQAAHCAFKFSLDPSYDQKATDEAITEFKQFVEENPDSKLSKNAKEKLGELNNKRAKKIFDVAVFYEKQGKENSAAIYYEEVVKKYPNTKWGSKAVEKLTVIKEKK